jgi:hypothetical protein
MAAAAQRRGARIATFIHPRGIGVAGDTGHITRVSAVGLRGRETGRMTGRGV